MADAGLPKRAGDASPSREEFRDLLKRAENGDESSLPGLRRLLDGGFRGLPVFDIAEIAREDIMKPLVGKNVAARELLVRRMQEIAAELAGPAPTPIERLLAERAAFCWHIVNAYERVYAGSGEKLEIRQADFHERRIDAAHRRYLSAMKTLATVRKMAVPALQINLARHQVNFAGVAPPEIGRPSAS